MAYKSQNTSSQALYCDVFRCLVEMVYSTWIRQIREILKEFSWISINHGASVAFLFEHAVKMCKCEEVVFGVGRTQLP